MASMYLQHISDKAYSLVEDLIGLFYPRVCAGCDAHLMKHEENLCLVCKHDLPKTYFWDYDVTPTEKLFWGKIPVQAACSFLHFEEGEVVQELMHRLKYKGKTGVGLELGKMFGQILIEKGWFTDTDIIVPIPLHFTKEKRRGYNQSKFIAEGLAESLGAELRSNLMQRLIASETQTKKSRYERSKNVSSVFKATHADKLRGKNVLLVDDVVTTGSTLTEAGAELVRGGVNKLYIVTLAIA